MLSIPPVAFLVTATARAEPLVWEDDPGERMTAWLRAQGESMETVKLLNGPASIGVGVAMMGVGVAGLADGVYPEHPNLGWLQLAVGAMGVGQGLVWMLIRAEPDARMARWSQARAQGVDPDEMARFEGELRAYPYIARMERALFVWSGLGLIFGGALVAGATPGANLPDGHAVASYVASGVYGGVGVALLFASLFFDLNDSAWERYQRGLAPPRKVSLTPTGLRVAFD